MVHNEKWLLPHLLDHYRALGITHFVFLDDRSTDRTRDILVAEDDCTLVVLESESSPVPHALSLQTKLMNIAAEQGGPGSWSLIVDADEFLILPEPFSTVGELVRYLEERSFNCAFAAMVDFYPERLSGRFYDPLPPLAGSRWFDGEPSFHRPPDQPVPVAAGTGVRPRLLRMLAERDPQTFHKLYGNIHYRFAKSWKVPLVKAGAGIRYINPKGSMFSRRSTSSSASRISSFIPRWMGRSPKPSSGARTFSERSNMNSSKLQWTGLATSR